MKAAFIERHNVAARLIVGEVLKGHHGNRVVCADIGSQAKVGHLLADENRISCEVLSDSTFFKCGLDATLREKLRPDALILETTNEESLRQQSRKRSHNGSRQLPTTIVDRKDGLRRRKAFILEVGHASETRFHEKYEAKTAQHEQLIKLLHVEGYTPVIMPIILGNTGGIFERMSTDLESLEVTSARTNIIKTRLHIHSIQSMHAIIRSRRATEGQIAPKMKRKKKPPDR